MRYEVLMGLEGSVLFEVYVSQYTAILFHYSFYSFNFKKLNPKSKTILIVILALWILVFFLILDLLVILPEISVYCAAYDGEYKDIWPFSLRSL